MNVEKLKSESAISGSIWIFFKILVVNFSNVFVVAYLARQLTPKEFGVVALANVILKFIGIIGSQGIGEFVINNNNSDKLAEKLSASFWMDVAFTLISFLIGIALVAPLTTFYHEPALFQVLIVILFNFLLNSLAKIPEAIVAKKMKFKQLEIRNVILSLLSGVIGVTMAFLGYGVYSLIIPATILAPIKIIIAFKLAEWQPRLKFYFEYWKEIFKYSSYVIYGTLTSFLITDGDSLLIGRLLDAKALGVYNLGWQSAHLPVRNINSVISRIGLPTFAKFNGDLIQLRGALSKMMGLLATTTLPFLIVLFVAADSFILVVYGSQWIDSILVMRVLIIFVIRYSLGNPTGMIYKTLNRPDITFKFGLAVIPFYFLSIWIGSFYGIVGVAVGLTLVRTIFGVFDFKIVSNVLNCSFLDVIRPLFMASKASLIMGVLISLIKIYLIYAGIVNPVVCLFVLFASAIIIYLLLLRMYFKSIALEINFVSAKLLGKYNIYVQRILKIS
jgi:O-antigen/teichoic acid export membrane protein